MTFEPRRRDPVLRWDIGSQLGDITVQWLWGTGAVHVYWGDPTPFEVLGLNEIKRHHFERTGAHKVSVRRIGGDRPILSEQQVIIRDHKPALSFALDPDQPGVIVATAPATLDKTGILPRYRVHWNYQVQPALYSDFWGLPNASVRHRMPPGDYTARVIDTGSKWWVETAYTIPAPTLDCTVTAEGYTATLTVTTSVPGKDMIVSWGDKSLNETITGSTATHDYPAGVADTYLVQLVYSDASETSVKTIAIPGGSP